VRAETGRRVARWRWLPDAGAIVTVAALVLIKCWPLVRPWEREYIGGDFALSIEPHFYHWLKRGVVLLWDPTIGTGSWLLGGGTHPRFPVIANLHLLSMLPSGWALCCWLSAITSPSTGWPSTWFREWRSSGSRRGS